MSDENEERGLLKDIIGRELLDEERIEAKKIVLRDILSKNLEDEGYPKDLADRISRIPEIVSELSGEVTTSVELAERFEKKKVVNKVTDFLLVPIVNFIEKNSSSQLEKEAMLDKLNARLRDLLSLDSKPDHKLDNSDSLSG